jgi:hypothetical protein
MALPIRLVLFVLFPVSFLPAADVLTVDSASTVIVTGGTPASAAAGEVRLGAGQVNASGAVTAGNVVIGRGTQAAGAEAVRGDDPRMTNARPASGGDAATVGGSTPSAFVAASAKGAANGVASLDATGKVPAAQLPATSGSATAWVVFGPTGAILGAYNVSSVTHGGTGDYTLHFTNAMANTNYVAVGNTSTGANGVSTVQVLADAVSKTTTSLRVLTYVYNALSDGTTNIVIFGP